MRNTIMFWIATIACCGACYAANGPSNPGIAPTTVEAGVAIVKDVCDIIEGTDDNGVFRTLCATAEEVGRIVEFILLLRPAGQSIPDAGCTPKGSQLGDICSTSAERAKAILYITKLRSLRFSRDGGK